MKNNMKAWITKKQWMTAGMGIVMGAVIFCSAGMYAQAATGKITADSAKVRAEANTSSSVTGSVKQGATIDILDEVKDSSGTVWYKVADGYIRSDLVTKDGDSSSSTASTTTTSNTTTATDTSSTTDTSSSTTPAATVPTAMAEQAASISVESVRIRSGASTEHGTVASLPKGTAVTLIGQATDSAGKTWYQMTCTYNGKTVEGYVRSDLITMGAAVSSTDTSTGDNASENADGGTDNTAVDENGNPIEGEVQLDENGNPIETPTEEASTEEASTEDTQNENNDYEVVYTQNEAGEYEYYLYDNVQGTRQKLSELLGVVDSANKNAEVLQSQINTEKIIIIVLAVLAVILLLVVTLLIFKIRELSYEDYDDEEEDEEEELDLEEEEPRKKRFGRKRTREEDEEDEDDEDEEEEPVRPVKKRTASTKGAAEKRPQTREGGSRSQEGRRTEGRKAEGRKSDSYPETRKSDSRQEKTVRRRDPDNGELRAAESKPEGRRTEKKSPQNFLLDDDEFEFEFLNMDDKDDK